MMRDRFLEIPERRVDELVTRQRSDDPTLGLAAASAREDLELVTAARALDGRAALGNQRVIEVIFGATSAAANVHPMLLETKE
jgi:hypothetical protein